MEPIKLEITILKPIQTVWETYTTPRHIMNWNFASPEWHCPKAENDLQDGGSFRYRMEVKDGSFGFDYAGIFDEVKPFSLLKSHLNDGRKAEVFLEEIDAHTTKVTQIFEPERQSPAEMQRQGWYQILDNFHKYTEAL